MGRPGYCTREAVKASLDSQLTANDDPVVDRAVLSAADTIDAQLHRSHLDPRTDTRLFDWPNEQRARPERLWLDQHGLITLTALTSGGDTIAVGDVFLEPVNDGPPYHSIEIDLDSSAGWGGTTGSQQNIAATGVWGLNNDQAPAGALAAALADTTGTTLDVTDGSLVGVWSLLTCGTERLIVTARAMLDSGQNLGTNLDDSDAAQTVNLTSGAAFHTGEEIQIDSERMLIREITGNNGTVVRAYNGSTLAAHTATTDIYVSRRLTVERGASGSTAATHLIAATLTVWDPGALIRAWSVAEATVQVAQELAQYGRTIGTGENQQEARGAGIADLRERAWTAHGRIRIGAI